MHIGNDMEQQSQEPTGIQIGDKIRIRSGPYSGARGVIQAQVDGILEILLDEGNSVHIKPQEITNYSLAARRAWQTMPKRSGRPQLSSPRKKMVSMRLDIDVWDQLGDAVELGFISSREEAINSWIRERLVTLFSKNIHLTEE